MNLPTPVSFAGGCGTGVELGVALVVREGHRWTDTDLKVHDVLA